MLKNECGTLEVSMKTITWKKYVLTISCFTEPQWIEEVDFQLLKKKIFSDDLKPAEAAFNDKKEIEQLTLFWICMKPFWHISCTTQTKKKLSQKQSKFITFNTFKFPYKFKWLFCEIQMKLLPSKI